MSRVKLFSDEKVSDMRIRAARLSLVYAWLLVAISLSTRWRVANAEDITLEGGDASVDDASSGAFGKPLANLSNPRSALRHDLGERGFHRNFAHVRLNGRRTLGPKFNNVSCASCHFGNGRGLVSFGRRASQSVVKVSTLFGRPAHTGAPIPVRGVGLQIRDHGLSPVKADGRLALLWELSHGTYYDGTSFELRKPIVQLQGASAKLPTGTMFSLRRPPPVFGAGLLEAIDATTILSMADPADADFNGISGRANLVWNKQERAATVGKFGFKASSPSLLQQVATAYSTDMGVTNPVFPEGDRPPDISQRVLGLTVFYAQTLAVPKARSQDDAVVQSGQRTFNTIGCAQCHVSTIITGQHSIAELSYQTIHPFTDLLLHDMGEGLADGRPDFVAESQEWRTTPLWGIGLSSLVLAGAEVTYLHDGRARTLEEAVLWHGGEAEASREAFMRLSANEREELMIFLRSL